jgi:hypothetical protein
MKSDSLKSRVCRIQSTSLILPIYNVGHFCTIRKVRNSLAETIIFIQSSRDLEELKKCSTASERPQRPAQLQRKYGFTKRLTRGRCTCRWRRMR